ncbi:MAG: ABC transporter substrate-binding protein [Peptostreptococcales bacterium]
MKNKMKYILLMMVLLVALVGCKGIDEESNAGGDIGQSTKVDVLRLEGGDTGLPNPFKHTSRGPGMSKMQILYDSLLEKDENGNIPWLAQDWSISEDGTVYTFEIVENAFWHDGTPLTTEDIVFTFNYYRQHSPVSNELIVNGEYIVKEARRIDEKKVEIEIFSFDNTYINKIGFARILPQHIWEDVEDPKAYDGEDAAIGSGPYKLDTYNPQQGTYKYVAFEQYWGLEPVVSAIEWVPVGDRVMSFENEEISLINASADILDRYQSDDKYTVKSVPSYHSYRLMMNMEKVEELKDIHLRKAIAYGINRNQLIENVARGSATMSSMGYVPADSPWYNPHIEKYDFDLEKAKELLDGKTYSFKLLIGNAAEEAKIAELVKLDLANIGIEIQIESAETKARDDALKTGEFEILLINSGGMGGDPDYLRTIYAAAKNGRAAIAGYNNEEINSLSQKQAIERDEAKRKEMIDEMQAILADEVPIVMLYGAVDNFVYVTEKYDGWMFRYDHNKTDHNKLSYLIREK